MAYIINLTNGDPLVTVDDGKAVFDSASIALIGKNYAGYGEYLNENMVHMLENFARDSQPSRPLRGQLWFNTSTGTLMVYNGSSFTPSANSVTPDSTSSAVNFVPFVSKGDGTAPQPSLKADANKGLSYHPLTGTVGINRGTKAATAKLEIDAGANPSRTFAASAATVAGAVIRINSDDDASAFLQIDSYGATDAQTLNKTSGLVVRKSRGSSNTPANLTSGDYLGGMSAAGYDNTNAFAYGGHAVFRASENWTSGTNHGTEYLIYNTLNAAGSPRLVAHFKNNGDLEVNYGDVIAYATSDSRLKDNIQPIDKALEKVMSLEGVTFNWNHQAQGKDQDTKQIGLLAQQVEQVVPEAVRERPDGRLGIAYEKLVPVLIEAIKELQTEVQRLKTA